MKQIKYSIEPGVSYTHRRENIFKVIHHRPRKWLADDLWVIGICRTVEDAEAFIQAVAALPRGYDAKGRPVK